MVSHIDIRRLGTFAVLGAVLLLFSCSDDENLVQPENAPPETTLEMEGPREVDGRMEILLRWSGEDPEGALSHYEWRLIEPDRDEASVGWTTTEEVEKRIDLTAEAAAHKEVALRFEVRAVDVGGLRDMSPATGSFTPVTQAPTVQLVDMPVTNTCLSAPEGGTIRWTADDPDSKGGPEATRSLILEVGGPSDPCLTRAQFEADNPFLHIATSDPRWSEWAPYDADDPLDPSRSLQLTGLQAGYSYLIGVQARDVDGATTRSFVFGENVAHVRIAESSSPPVLTVFEPHLGLDPFVGTLGDKLHQLPAEDRLAFQWAAVAGSPFGAIDAYRVGVNLIDPDDPNDPGWLGPWGSTQELAYDVPLQGTHGVVIQARDLAGQISRATYLFQVVQSPSQLRDLLLVDDWRNSPTTSGMELEAEQDQAWADLLDAALPGGWDVIDAQDDAASLDLVKLLEYRSVIWFTNASDLSFLHTAFAPSPQGEERYNWLEAAQRNQISLMLVGPGAAWSLVEHPSQRKFFPQVFDVPAGGSLGFGVLELPSGETLNRGTLRTPYRGFCVDLFDQVRPALGQVYGELPGELARTLSCDAMLHADPAVEFSARFPTAPSIVLRPTAERENLDPRLQLPAEEFYDLNVTTRPDVPALRDCKVPMFRLRSRRAGDVGVDPSACSPAGEVSPIEEAPVALASFAYSDLRDDPGRADFLWGFNPLGFVSDDVQVVLEWVLRDHWGLGS